MENDFDITQDELDAAALADQLVAQPFRDEITRQHAEIERMRALLMEAGALFRLYEQSHRAKGPGHEAKVERNAEIAGRIEAVLTPNCVLCSKS